ncbi:MAG: ATP-dependent RNA helicase RhlE [Candidatus Paceibacteria bacterium]
MSFATFGLSKELLRAVESAGFVEPRPIQAKTIPSVLEGRDVLGLAQTGTGKTAAFGLPILEGLIHERRGRTRVLILAPTRELAMQIDAEIRLLGQHTPITTLTIFGGVGAGKQIRGLSQHPDILVACPGRLLDLYGQGKVNLKEIDTLVLDEADHMFHMGFLPDIKKILRALPARRQNLLFSATMPREIRGLTDSVLQRPIVVELSHSKPGETISHALYPVDKSHKADLLQHILRDRKFESAIVFLRTKHRCKRLAQMLSRSGLSAVALQGNMSQGQRVRAMDGFRAGHHKILVATDIAARGIDVDRVSLVINFDIPNTPDAYTHRIGRTGRAERSGEACTFVTSEDFDMVKEIEKRLGEKIPRHEIKGFGAESSVSSEFPEGRSDGGRSGRPGSGQGGRRGGGGRGRGRGAGRRGSTRQESSSQGTQKARDTSPKPEQSSAGSPGHSAAFGSNIPRASEGGSERRMVGGGRPRRGRGRGRGAATSRRRGSGSRRGR